MELIGDVPAERIPRHIAIIMDGNGRWAVRQGLERVRGHQEGAKSVRTVLKRPIAHSVVNDYRSAISSLNSGTPFMAQKPDSALGRGVLELARLLDAQPVPAAEVRQQLEFVPAL